MINLNNPQNLSTSALSKSTLEYLTLSGIEIETIDRNGNVNCKNCTDCVNCIESRDCRFSHDCVMCDRCVNCNRCETCRDCADCYGLIGYSHSYYCNAHELADNFHDKYIQTYYNASPLAINREKMIEVMQKFYNIPPKNLKNNAEDEQLTTILAEIGQKASAELKFWEDQK